MALPPPQPESSAKAVVARSVENTESLLKFMMGSTFQKEELTFEVDLTDALPFFFTVSARAAATNRRASDVVPAAVILRPWRSHGACTLARPHRSQ
jgi:hypothetical protein